MIDCTETSQNKSVSFMRGIVPQVAPDARAEALQIRAGPLRPGATVFKNRATLRQRGPMKSGGYTTINRRQLQNRLQHRRKPLPCRSSQRR